MFCSWCKKIFFAGDIEEEEKKDMESVDVHNAAPINDIHQMQKYLMTDNLASSLMMSICEKYKPCKMIIYTDNVDNGSLVQFYLNENNKRWLSIRPPNAENRTRIKSNEYSRDFMLYCRFIVNAICLVHKDLEIILMFACDSSPEVFRNITKDIMREINCSKKDNILSFTILWPKDGTEDEYDSHVMLMQ
jgi:hypothetical protein